MTKKEILTKPTGKIYTAPPDMEEQKAWFEFKDAEDNHYRVQLSSVLDCVIKAEEQNLLPPISNDWWIDVINEKAKNKYAFVNKEHEQFFQDHEKLASYTLQHAALVYTLGIDEMCRMHWDDLVDDNLVGSWVCVKPEALYQGWQTSGSFGITKLAFNLFTSGTPDIEENRNNNADMYCITDIFRGLDNIHREGALLAIKYFA